MQKCEAKLQEKTWLYYNGCMSIKCTNCHFVLNILYIYLMVNLLLFIKCVYQIKVGLYTETRHTSKPKIGIALIPDFGLTVSPTSVYRFIALYRISV